MQKAVWMISAMAFLLPVSVILLMHWDDVAATRDADARPQGKLLYFYSPS